MKSTDAAVSDAGPLIHLDELGWLFVLESFATVWVPPEVAEEAARHRPKWQSAAPANVIIDAFSQETWEWWRTINKFDRLDRGERTALALWRSHQDAILLGDDLHARMLAQVFKIPLMGTLGLILRVGHLGLRSISEVRAILNDLPKRSTLHLKPALLQKVLAALPEK
jgi:predicted nucleic acid-binding protein